MFGPRPACTGNKAMDVSNQLTTNRTLEGERERNQETVPYREPVVDKNAMPGKPEKGCLGTEILLGGECKATIKLICQ
jgi:hypothetical protein